MSVARDLREKYSACLLESRQDSSMKKTMAQRDLVAADDLRRSRSGSSDEFVDCNSPASSPLAVAAAIPRVSVGLLSLDREGRRLNKMAEMRSQALLEARAKAQGARLAA